MQPLEPINFATTPIIKTLDGTKENVDASGFFFKNNEIKYLVTAKHVFENKNPSQFKILTHTAISNIKPENHLLRINLFDKCGNKLWLEHNNHKVDVALIPLSCSTMDNDDYVRFLSSKINFFSRENFFVNYIYHGQIQVRIIGYPLGYYDKQHNFPIFKGGSIASPYGNNFEGHPYFVVDADLYSGSSGSCVINSPSNLINRVNEPNGIFHTDACILLGVHVAEAKNNNSDTEKTNLNKVFYAELITDIINRYTTPKTV
jgi:hypothetical protein